MAPTLADTPCISVKSPGRNVKIFTLVEYEATVAYAHTLASPAVQDREDVDWARFAPSVEDLTDPPESAFLSPRFRICDPEAYDFQMRQLLGLV